MAIRFNYQYVLKYKEKLMLIISKRNYSIQIEVREIFLEGRRVL